MTVGDGETYAASLEIVEWKMPTERRMYLLQHYRLPSR